ncbi:MAG TPA: hypothetical protein VFN97_08160 [Actinospica sp.]|nr:hypothetical protein [Actinospica sp.]
MRTTMYASAKKVAIPPRTSRAGLVPRYRVRKWSTMLSPGSMWAG